jgi:hypothetical protein
MKTYATIQSSDELKERVKDNILSVGIYLSSIYKFLSLTPTEDKNMKVTVRYSSTYGTTDREFYI